MLNQEIVSMLNEQVNKELYSVYLYLDVRNFYEGYNLNGFSNWFNVQMQEERDHAALFQTYLLNNGEKVLLKDIPAPNSNFSDLKAPLETVLEHEKYITASINNIYSAAYNSKDFRTMQFLDWFIKEQSEEEKNSDDLIKKYDLFCADGKGLYLVDSELAARVYTPPTLVI